MVPAPTFDPEHQSWGRVPRAEDQSVVKLGWRTEIPALKRIPGSLLGYGFGRSYGDSCLNTGGTLLETPGLDRYVSFDPSKGILACEAGARFDRILDLIVPRGWFLPVSPGTQFVSVGGAIANDVHGKNHHVAGTFGCHVTRLELLRSDGRRLLCSPSQNAPLFRATVGGLGLTGLITWAEFRLKKINNPFLRVEDVRFGNLDEFLALSEESSQKFEYIVSWVDCLARGKALGRGIMNRGNFAEALERTPSLRPAKPASVPMEFPAFALSKPSVQAFNFALYHKQWAKVKPALRHYVPFFYPLDAVLKWNRIYGRRGFYQYQNVVPFKGGRDAMAEILDRIAASGLGSFLVVIKTFGARRSPGLMSFPCPGITLAMDFPNQGPRTLALLESLDGVTRKVGGSVYPAKDGRMSAESFAKYFPQSGAFRKYVDPKFSSAFWRRVNEGRG